MQRYTDEFAARGHIGNPNKFMNRNRRVIEIDCTTDMFEDFAYLWCSNKPLTMLNREFKIIGYFSFNHPLEYKCREITIYLERIH